MTIGALLAASNNSTEAATYTIPGAQDAGRALVNGTGSTPVTLNYSFPGLSAAPNFSLVYGRDFKPGTPNCTVAATVTCYLSVVFQPHYPGVSTDAVIVKTQAGAVLGSTLLHGIGLASQAVIYPGSITTYAGTGSWSYSGDNQPAISASFRNPQGVAVDTAGNIYVADPMNQVVRCIAIATGTITTVAGIPLMAGRSGDGAPATEAKLNNPTAVAIDGAGNLYIADEGNNLIRKVNTASGIISTVAGGGAASAGVDGLNVGDGGLATTALLKGPTDVAVDGSGNLYIADSFNGLIRRVDATSGVITAAAGGGKATGTDGFGDGGPATQAQLNNPTSIAVDGAGNLYIADAGHNLIRFVNSATGIITAIAGNGSAGYNGDLGRATSAELYSPACVRLDAANNVYIADYGNNVIRQVQAASGTINTIAGNGAYGYYGDGGTSTAANMANPAGLALDFAGNIYIADNGNNVIRKVAFQTRPLSFGSTNIGLASPPQILTVENIGNSALTFSSISVTGTFRQQATGYVDCSPSSSVVAGASCTIGIAFVPTTTFSLTGGVSISTNALNLSSPVPIATLNGTGVFGSTPNIGLSVANLTFGNQTVGLPTTLPPVIVTNSGNAPLGMNGIWVSGANAADFSSTHTCGAVLAAGASCTVTVTFTPGAIGYRLATLTFTDSVASSPQTVSLTGTGIAMPDPYQITAGNFTLAQGASLNLGYASLVMQSDGNLVLYRSDGTPLWSTGTWGQKCGANQCFAVFQPDGNFVVYNGQKPLWNSGTWNPNAQLVFSSQTPQLEIVSNQSILWVSALRFSAGNFTLAQGASLNLGYASLVMQSDGNLVLYRSDGTPLWSTGTWGQKCGASQCFAAFQPDGNLVVYNGQKPLWNSSTWGNPNAQLVFSAQMPQLEIVSSQSILWANALRFSAGNFTLAQGASLNLGYASLVMQSDGNLVLYRSDGTPLWSTGTWGQQCGANQCFAVFQPDGNLVVYNGQKPLWNSSTSGNPNAQLVFSSQTPQLEIVEGGLPILWHN